MTNISTIANPLTVGQTVKAVEVPGMPEYNGQIVTVTQVMGDGRAYAEFRSITKPDDTERLYFIQWEPVEDGDTLTVSSPEGREAALQADVDRLTRELEAIRSQRDAAVGRADTYASDFDVVGTSLMEEAERRGWCSEYDEFVDTVNGKTQRLELPSREREVNIEWEETYTVTVRRTGTAMLTAGYDSDDIERAARDLNGNSDATREEVLQAVRDGEYESCDFVSGSAEEA